ncbi:3-oxoacyl-[acyl-carrier protein] reductase [Caenispirillum salinarum AK4]|uniref:3-oxoacyl-[acyl-carrier protein] reductase n=1 Tax=Caenispirillum salinarum AK4 TaxID=1238182 RepID=K9HPZ6_9PROT|nr:glucose 1-dehydrogenase [Caenispirillum salinarum]EKV30526.1 3-oxoacyl-[acyl-carrier protein] reductase [Caenispirillum salinarum AK4]
MDLRLDGKVALVTGASGGLGRHFAGVLAAAGATVVLAARRTEKLAEAVEEIGPGRAHAVPLDVTDPTSVTAAFEAAEAATGAVVDVLVNNAGLAKTAPALETSPQDWRTVLDTNLTGAFHVATEAAARMKAAGRAGSIVNIASIVGLRPAGAVASYAASKAGLIHLTKALALELARDDVRVNALAPGYIETDINAAFFATDAGQKLIKRIPQRRLGRMSDLDAPLLMLCSDASAFMTGAVVPVDGGHLVSSL